MGSFAGKALAGHRDVRAILSKMSFTIPFNIRLQIFEAMLDTDRRQHQDPRHKHRAQIRRNFMVDDGLGQLNGLGRQLKGMISVEFINEYGLAEAGIDAGGVFKEYLCQLITQVFSQEYGLFKATHNRQLYPNPQSKSLQPNHLAFFAFLGRMLGKAMYDGIVIDTPFAYFFLSRLLGRSASMHELQFLDEDLYKNLNVCKNYEGDIEDLCLTFTVTQDFYGKVEERELIDGGRDVEVTKDNVHQYIYLVAHLRLNQDIAAQANAFLAGFRELVPLEWLQMFDQRELQRLISGDDGGDFDVKDLAANTEYHGGYSAGHGTIKDFWKVLTEFSPAEKSALLRFVTSCPRPPLQGFKAMHPPFKIQLVDCNVAQWQFWTDAERLPSASTCFNLLKLPNYNKRSTLRDKLKQAIESGAGFELS